MKSRISNLVLFVSLISIFLVLNSGSVLAASVNISPRGYLDAPTYGATLSGVSNIKGWFLDGSGVNNVEILIDGNPVGTAQYGQQRLDVGKAFPDYQNNNSGYQYSLDTKSLTNGQHFLAVKETGKNGLTTVLPAVKVNVQNVTATGTKGYIDAPTNGSVLKGQSVVRGWFLDGSGVSAIQVLVDGNPVGTAQYGLERTDVGKAFPAYQNNNSGYQYTLNTSSLANGQHSVAIKETGKNGLTTVLPAVNVNVQNATAIGAKGYLDAPANNSVLTGDSNVRGWFLDGSGVSTIQVLVDGNPVGTAQYGLERTDVGKAFPAYQNNNSGYQYTLNTIGLSNGKHSIAIKETGKNGSTTQLPAVTVSVQNLPAKGYLDAPAAGSVIKGNSVIHGWFLDGSGVSKIDILVDGTPVGTAQYGQQRLDVGKAFSAYQNNNSGYQYTLNTTNLTNGNHILTVEETGNNGTTTSLQNINVNVQNPPVKGYIDAPANGSAIKGSTVVSGWFLDVSGVSKIEVWVDGKLMGEAQYGLERLDVGKAFPAYQNNNSGYQYTLDPSTLTGGQHTLSVKETGNNGATTTVSITITVNPYTLVDLRKPANITATDIASFFANSSHPDSPLKNYAQSFIDAQSKYGVNALYLVAHAILETGWGFSDLAVYKHNLYGYGAYDVGPFTCAYYFPSMGDSINYEAYVVRRDYLDSTGYYYNGPNLIGMNVKYATDKTWSDSIANLMESIKPYDASYYAQASILPETSTAPGSYGRNIPDKAPVPTDVVINNTTATYATVNTGGVALRTIPYVSSSTLISSLSQGTVIQVLGYDTDVEYVQGNASYYPYDYRWYRVLVNGQEGWVYGGAITFK